MKIKHFKELSCWQKSRELVKLTYSLTKKEAFSKDFGLRDQIQRAAVSVMANIAEGFGTNSDIDFIRYLSIAIRSAYEVQSHLYVALDTRYVNQAEFGTAELLSNDCINLTKGFIRYLKNKSKDAEKNLQVPKYLSA